MYTCHKVIRNDNETCDNIIASELSRRPIGVPWNTRGFYLNRDFRTRQIISIHFKYLARITRVYRRRKHRARKNSRATSRRDTRNHREDVSYLTNSRDRRQITIPRVRWYTVKFYVCNRSRSWPARSFNLDEIYRSWKLKRVFKLILSLTELQKLLFHSIVELAFLSLEMMNILIGEIIYYYRDWPTAIARFLELLCI